MARLYQNDKSLCQLAEQEIEVSVKPTEARRSLRSRVAYHPKINCSRQLNTLGELIPITLNLDGQNESFLWDMESTNYEDPYYFAMDLIEERYPNVPKNELFLKAQKVAQMIVD
jgi:hypothetical protein